MANVQCDADVEVDDFLFACSKSEIKEVIQWLKDEGELLPNESPANEFVNESLMKIS